MADCLFIGSTTRDLLMLVEAPPASDRRIFARACVNACGGIASVSASAFEKLGGRAALITAVGGPSETTDFIEANLAARDLDSLCVIRIPDMESPFSVIQVESDGKRCITHAGGCMNALTLDMIPKEEILRAKRIHIGGLKAGLIEELTRYCRERTDALISVDGGNLSKETIEAILPFVDVFIPDDKTVAQAHGLTPEDACRYYADRGVSISVVTMGDKGSVAVKGGEFYRVPAVPVRAVDTTGAGDNFHGAFMYCLAQGWDMTRTLRFCSAFSALTCLSLGGIAGEPSLEETLRVMEERYGS